MTAQAPSEPRVEARPLASRILRWVGWTLIAAGCVVLLYLVYSLLFTNLETDRAQAQLLDTWEREVGALASQEPAADGDGTGEETGGGDPDPAVREAGELPPAELGAAVARIEFVRPSSGEPVVHDDPLMVVHGVTLDILRSGPGHYPETALPGQDGNFAVAGHRTTYGAPFFSLDELEEGDEIHVTGRDGRRHTYEVVASEVVRPRDIWVIAPDPLESGRPLMTLTTCHPRFSAAQRLVVFAELVS